MIQIKGRKKEIWKIKEFSQLGYTNFLAKCLNNVNGQFQCLLWNKIIMIM